MALLKRLLPACWLRHPIPNQSDDTQNEDGGGHELEEAAVVEAVESPKQSTSGSFVSKMRVNSKTKKNKSSLRKTPHHRRNENGNRLSVDMHEEDISYSAASNDESCNDFADEVEIVKLSQRQKEILKSTWTLIYAELGQTLCYVGEAGGQQENSGGMAETFLRLFEEYPQSQQFFSDFNGTPIEALRQDARLSKALEEHAVRVVRVVEKVIGRLEDLEKVHLLYTINLVYWPNCIISGYNSGFNDIDIYYLVCVQT
jgi:hypothetical protein